MRTHGAHASANTIVPNHVNRELVITVPLPDDKGRRGDGRPKVRRFRSHWLELGQRLVEFRARYGITQAETAVVVGAGNASTVAQWESGINVPEGIRRERLVDLLEGRLWRELRETLIPGDGMPSRWNEAARWYRRASRERSSREMVGAAIAAILDDLRVIESPASLRRHYCARDGDCVRGVLDRCGLSEEHLTDLRRVEDAAYGLRWLETVHDLRFHLGRSLVHQLPLALLDRAPDGTMDQGNGLVPD
jgi:transcriptional regulator with XRE-family HTH domain